MASAGCSTAACPILTERFPPRSFAGILQTHYHADHAQGLLHLRWGQGLVVPVHGPADPEGLADLYKHPGILDFSQPFAPRNHNDLTLALGIIERLAPDVGVLTHVGHTLDAWLIDKADELPEQVRVAFDGMGL